MQTACRRSRPSWESPITSGFLLHFLVSHPSRACSKKPSMRLKPWSRASASPIEGGIVSPPSRMARNRCNDLSASSNAKASSSSRAATLAGQHSGHASASGNSPASRSLSRTSSAKASLRPVEWASALDAGSGQEVCAKLFIGHLNTSEVGHGLPRQQDGVVCIFDQPGGTVVDISRGKPPSTGKLLTETTRTTRALASRMLLPSDEGQGSIERCQCTRIATLPVGDALHQEGSRNRICPRYAGLFYSHHNQIQPVGSGVFQCDQAR